MPCNEYDKFYRASNIQEASYHTMLLDSWDLSYNQTTSGRFQSCLNEINFEGIQLYEESFIPSIFQKGSAKPLCISLGMFMHLDEPAVWKGKQIKDKHILSIISGEEIMLHTPQNSTFFALSAPLELFETQYDEILHHSSKVLTNLEIIQQLHPKFCSLFHALLNQPMLIATKKSRSQIKLEMIELIKTYLDHLTDHPNKFKVSTKKAHQIVKQAIEAVQNTDEYNLSINDLCSLTYTCRRTLQNSFEQVTGLSPALFFKYMRLNAVRKVLAQSEEIISISEVAMNFGFWHLSQFSSDYKRLFAESPSETLRINRRIKHLFH
ncbi:helix-turn-helix domain-containing protein [Acinetobacter qingfengensis]|uniref:HTH araC/xylS-type domain-containing protein n=1 Tax=Acinetobacter qingfengensis TaxID=1262585 RepID=A0A1E7R4X7_9GAMM|nr:helix-turn-helix domain-containing protein [Acinetobacter qingfengensis]KAA8732367.1 helix-turn-helix domain-containing protein [Acinetobacter qingfengensis]OEY94362.1 hypothetical protein BJI46_03195 [Acinetobacter qingfengensis]